MAKYRMTPRRKAALHKAQLASARKRKARARHTRNRRLAVAGGVTVLAATTGALAHQYVTRTARGGPRRTWQPGPRALERGVGHIFSIGDPGWKTQQAINKFDKTAASQARIREKKRKGELKKSRRRQRYWQTQHDIPKRNRFTRAQARRRRGK